ncbi:Ig-like domain-containing protein [uncultured Flavonifractor sp.]|uniref:Ig-like domain-containing protein n=1 Tax=uncultured Flavonifractor sp. TaxID=1193534 RepID=UPI002628F304|nr:Ig-like domain-containing protein [uncultured Flavonifractor sp.]
MASRRSRDDRPKMIHCEYCGEDYASTYKHCPFCDEVPLDDEDFDGDEDSPRRVRGGKRLVTNTRGGGYGRGPSPLRLVGIIISLAIIIAAVIIVISVIIPLVTKGSSVTDPSTVESVMPTDSAQPSVEPTDSPEPTETIPADQTATDFTLSLTEFSLSNRYPDPITLTVTFIPEGSTGTITWTSSDPEVASVDETGKVSAGTKTGNATITATMPGGVTHTCLVHNSVTTGASTSTGSGSGTTTSTALSLNRTDFTLSKTYPSFQVEVSGTSSTPVWSIGNSAVATVSGDGTVTYVGKGTTTLTCTVDGKTLTCTVRCT